MSRMKPRKGEGIRFGSKVLSRFNIQWSSFKVNHKWRSKNHHQELLIKRKGLIISFNYEKESIIDDVSILLLDRNKCSLAMVPYPLIVQNRCLSMLKRAMNSTSNRYKPRSSISFVNKKGKRT
jgi:hypothetical protein